MVNVRRRNLSLLIKAHVARRQGRERSPSATAPWLLFLLGWALVGCGAQASLPYPGTGLGIRDQGLVWELTVGVLNSRDFPRINRKQAREFLDRAAGDLNRELPGLQVRFILDQPLDASFMMERLIRKKARLAARFRDESRILFLDGGSSSKELNRKKVAAAGLKPGVAARMLKHVELLRNKRVPGSETPVLSDRMESSDLVWREFLRQQVRYDLVLTNALVFGDDLDVPVRFQGEPGAARMRISRAEGRTGMEGLAAYISLYGGTGNGRERDLRAALLALILPAPAESFTGILLEAGPASNAAGGSAEQWPACSGCPDFWKRRLAYLRGVAHIHRANFKAGCPLLKANAPQSGNAPGLLRLNKARRELAARNHGLLLRKCPTS